MLIQSYRRRMNFYFITDEAKKKNYDKTKQRHNVAPLDIITIQVNDRSHDIRKHGTTYNGHHQQ